MSIDFKLFAICDHKINQELVQIDSDYRTIRIPRIVSSNNVDLYVNGNLVLPNSGPNSYSIENDEFAISSYRRKIVFSKKRKSVDDFYEISYSVSSGLCPKCTGLKILNDQSYNNLGLINTVSNEEKLLQEVKKGLLTVLGSNPFHTWWGTKINSMIGTKIVNVDSVRATMIQEVSIFLEKYLDIQTQQSQYQSVTDREALYQILLIDVDPNPDDPTVWTLSVIFQNRTGADMVFEKKFEVPTALAGNITLSL